MPYDTFSNLSFIVKNELGFHKGNELEGSAPHQRPQKGTVPTGGKEKLAKILLYPGFKKHEIHAPQNLTATHKIKLSVNLDRIISHFHTPIFRVYFGVRSLRVKCPLNLWFTIYIPIMSVSISILILYVNALIPFLSSFFHGYWRGLIIVVALIYKAKLGRGSCSRFW